FSGGLILTMNFDGSARRLLASSSDFSGFPQTMPGNGDVVAYYTGNPGATSVIRIAGPPGTGASRIVTTSPGSAWPRWSADGQWIYHSARDLSSSLSRSLARIHSDGTGNETLLTYSAPPLAAPGLSPDGRT